MTVVVSLRRIFNFQLVALGGTAVNMGVLWLLRGQMHLPVLVAGACAIELAIIPACVSYFELIG